VHAEYAGEARIAQETRDGLVGRDHGLLDELRRIGTRTQDDVDGHSLAIELDLRLHRIEIKPSSSLAQPHPLLRNAREPLHAPSNLTCKRGVLSHFLTLNKPLRLPIGKPCIGTDERRIYIDINDFTRIVHKHVHRHRPPHLVGLERADIVGKLFGQHGNHTIDEVNARGPTARIEVHRRPPGHIMRHVRNMHPHAPILLLNPLSRVSAGIGSAVGQAERGQAKGGARSTCLPALGRQVSSRRRRVERSLADGGSDAGRHQHSLNRHRIIEIARIIRVNRKHEAVAQIAVAARQRRVFINARIRRLRKRRFRERRLEFVARDDQVDGHALVVRIPEHLDDATGGRLLVRWIRDHLDAHDGSVGYVGIFREHGEDVVGYAWVFGHHHPERLGMLEPAHY